MPQQSCKILLIDDDSNLRLLMKRILETAGHTVSEALGVAYALNLIQKDVPDLIFLDLNLNNEHGAEFLSIRYTDPVLSKIPIIICSGEKRSEIIQKIASLGIDDYILKPIKQDIILRKVKKVLKKPDFLEFTFSDNKNYKIDACVWAEIVALGEVYCKVSSSVRFLEQGEFYLSSTHFSEVIGERRFCRTNYNSLSSHNGVYDSFCTLVGTNEKEVSNLRKLKISWRSKK